MERQQETRLDYRAQLNDALAQANAALEQLSCRRQVAIDAYRKGQMTHIKFKEEIDKVAILDNDYRVQRERLLAEIDQLSQWSSLC